MARVLLTVWILFCSTTYLTATDVGKGKSKVLLMSFDGFRWDYVDKFDTPNLHMLAREGVQAPLGVRPAFVTKTFPNHYTLATGLYEENHGIVSNKMYDEVLNATFTNKNNETRWWSDGEPIWTTATLQGLKVGVYAWPGSNVRLRNVWPYRFEPYVKKVPFEQRMDTIIKWLTVDGVDLAVAYFHEPDNTGHRTGAMSRDVEQAVRKVDALLGGLMDNLKKAGAYETTDILIVSDHGMTNITADQEHVVVISDYLNFESEVEVMPDDGALVNILPKKGQLEVVYQKLVGAHPNMTVYRKQDIPDRFHYKNHRRILPIVAMVDEGYYIVKDRPSGPDARPIGPGEHGYDNGLPSMRPIFFARGPHFRPGYSLPASFETVNVYPLVCQLLGIEPAPNNGSFLAFGGMLRSASNRFNIQTMLLPFIQVALNRII